MKRAAKILIGSFLLLLPVATAFGLRYSQQTELHLKWQIDTNSPDVALRADSGIYVASTDSIAAYDTNGEKLWAKVVKFDKSAQRDFLQSDVSGNAYLLLEEELVSFSPSGEELWTYKFSQPLGAMTLIAMRSNGIYLIVDGSVISLNNQGQELWQYTDNALVMHSPLVDHLGNLYYQPIYDVSPNGHTGQPVVLRKAVCLRVTGKKYWEKTDAGFMAVWKERLFLSTSRGLECCNLQGDVVWSNPQLTHVSSITPDIDGVIYLVGGASQQDKIRVCAVDQQGKIFWDCEFTIDHVDVASARGQPAILNNTLYVGASGLPKSSGPGFLGYVKLFTRSSVPSMKGQVLAIDAVSGKLKWSFEAEDIVESEILSEHRTGTLYLPSWYDHVYALHAD